MSKLEKLKEKARNLEAKDPKGAIEAWQHVLKGQEEEGDPNPDLAVFNRIGDLYLKVREPAQAADYYDQAVDKYAELCCHNNAIAMCNKVLRNAPGRQTTYLKLAKLYASKGFMAEAKQNFVEYAERMHKAGKIQHAFAALKEFADISAESAHLRQTLEDHLRMYGDPERRPGAATTAPAAPKPQPPDDPSKSGRRKTSSLVFLDVDAQPAGKPPVTGRVPPPPKLPPKPALEPEPVVESLIEPVIAEPDTSLEIETTSLVDGLEPRTAGGMLEGFETTSAEFGEIQLDAQPAPSLQDEVSPDDIPPPAEFEPTVAEEETTPDAAIELEPLLETEIEIEAPVAKAPPPLAPVVPKRPGVGAPPRFGGASPKAPESPKVKPVVPKRPGPPARKPMVEVPPLELEPDFDTGATDGGHEVDDQPLPIDDAGVGRVCGGRRSGAIDLSLDGVVTQGDEPGSLVFANIDAPPAKPTIEDLEGRVADDPDDPEGHKALGEALIEAGERERGIEELDLATTGFETRGNLRQAQDLVDEILRLDPNSVRHRQKQVEFAFKSRDEAVEAGDFVDLSAMILEDDLPVRDTRMKVADEEPTGDEERDFQEMLARFKQGIEENIDEGDFQSHYDLGVAFKEMGLLDEA